MVTFRPHLSPVLIVKPKGINDHLKLVILSPGQEAGP